MRGHPLIRIAAACVLGSACGRIGFGAQGGDGDGRTADAAPPLAVQWSRSLGTASIDDATGLRVAADGTLVAVATCGPEQLVFVDGTEPPAGGLALMVYAGADGNRLGTLRSPAGRIQDARLDRAGDDLAVVANFSLTVNVGGADLVSNANSLDVLHARYGVSSGHRSSGGLGGNGHDVGNDMALTPTGGACAVGWFLFRAGFGGAIFDNQGADDVWVACFDATGAHRWSAAFGGLNSDLGNGIAVDQASNVYIVGRLLDPISFGGAPVSPIGGTDLFVASFDADGVHRWSRAYGGPEAEEADRISIDPDGNLVVTGTYMGASDLGAGALPAPAEGQAIFVANLRASDGSHLWSRSLGVGAVSDLAVADARVALAGAFDDITSADGGRTIAVVLDRDDGAMRGARGANSAHGKAVTLGGDGAVYVGGYFNVEVQLGDTLHESVGLQDAFVARLQ